MKQALEALERGETKLRYEAITALRAAIEQTHGDWDEVETLRASLREHMAEIQRLRAAIEQPKLDDRTLYKMKQAMIKEHWRSIDSQWKDDPELCHALGYEAGYKDAVARRVEPRFGGSGAGFESLPASPHKMTEKNT